MTHKKVANFDSLMTMIKTKIQETDDPRTKIHLLTLAPNSWPITRLQEYFQVRLKVELIYNIYTISRCIFVFIYSLYIQNIHLHCNENMFRIFPYIVSTVII